MLGRPARAAGSADRGESARRQGSAARAWHDRAQGVRRRPVGARTRGIRSDERRRPEAGRHAARHARARRTGQRLGVPGHSVPRAGLGPAGAVPAPPAPGWSPLPPPPPGQPAWTGAALPGVAGWGAIPQAPKPGVVPLRPLGVGEILDGAISYARRDPRTVLGISAAISLVQALTTLGTMRLFGDALGSLSAFPPDPTTGTYTNDLASSLIRLVAGSLVTIVVSFVLGVLAVGLLTTVMSQAVLGRRVTLREAWTRTAQRFWALVGVTLLVGLFLTVVGGGGLAIAIGVGYLVGSASDAGVGVLVGFILAVGAGILVAWAYVRLLLAPVAVVLERVGPVRAMTRSGELVKGAWWRTLGITLLAMIIAGVVSQVISLPFSLVGALGVSATGSSDALPWSLMLITTVGSLLASIITLPFTSGVTALLYVDRRIRREALDIELQRAAAEMR